MVQIEGFNDLHKDMQTFNGMFPYTHTKYEDVKRIVEKHYEDPLGSIFGIEVATDWQDKCYGFEVDRIRGEITYIRYLGIWKT